MKPRKQTHGVKMKVGKTQKRILMLIDAEKCDAIDDNQLLADGVTLNNVTATRLIYKYIPYFLKEYEGMPKLYQFSLDGIMVEKASPLWIANNIDITEAAQIFTDGLKENELQEDEKKN